MNDRSTYARRRRRSRFRIRIVPSEVVMFVGLFVFWFVLSERTEPLFLITGLITALVVTAATHRLIDRYVWADSDPLSTYVLPVVLWRLVMFAVWIAGRILVASVQLAVIALSPKMPLDPCTVRFRTELRRPMARALLANSISLVPGTLTVDIEGDEFVVHALAPDQVDDLVSGRLQNRVARVFFEVEQPPVDPSAIRRGDVHEVERLADGDDGGSAP